MVSTLGTETGCTPRCRTPLVLSAPKRISKQNEIQTTNFFVVGRQPKGTKNDLISSPRLAIDLEINFAAVLLGREIWKSNSQPCCWAVRFGNQLRSRVAGPAPAGSSSMFSEPSRFSFKGGNGTGFQKKGRDEMGG